MTTQPAWIEVTRSEAGWQALCACQVCLQPFETVRRLLWGFNPSFLLSEALDRQKLFIESQFHSSPLEEIHPEKRALALRCQRIPEKGLLLALVGKVSAPTRAEALEAAQAYSQELAAIFPLDYKIYPATSARTFAILTGKEIFTGCRQPQSLMQILRVESALRSQQGSIYLNGFWQGMERADEQIWRTLGNFPRAVMLNISLRPTRLDASERQLLWEMEQTLPDASSPSALQPYERWVQPLLKRRLNPWKRFYLVQVHLIAPEGVSEALVRPIGSAITRESEQLSSPGYMTRAPENSASLTLWRQKLAGLELVPVITGTPTLPHLSHLVDLEEAQAVFRFPYPPEPGLPGVHFLEKLDPDE